MLNLTADHSVQYVLTDVETTYSGALPALYQPDTSSTRFAQDSHECDLVPLGNSIWHWCAYIIARRCSGVLRLIQDFLGRPNNLLTDEVALTPALCDQKRAELLLYKLLNQVDSPAARLKVSANAPHSSFRVSLKGGVSMTQLCC